MIGENGIPDTPDWKLPPREVEPQPANEDHITRGDN
jgi:hypothetical protein